MLHSFVANLVMSRSLFAAQSATESILDPPSRNLDKECGYTADLDIRHYVRMYRRWGIAARAVNVLPDECFAVYPTVYEVENEKTQTPFEEAWKGLNKRLSVCHYLHRADRLSGIGRFGVLLLGLSDGPLDRPVAGVDPKTGERGGRQPRRPLQLLYLRPFSEEHVSVVETEQDTRSPRYNQPTLYEFTLQSASEASGGASSSYAGTFEKKRVHWTRVIHLADNREASDVWGVPRLEQVFNYLLDLRKTGGGSAEMFYKGAFPGFSFETIPDLLGESIMDEESVRDQFMEYMEGLKRYLALDGVTAKPLLPQTADPTAHANLQLMLICATLAVPLRIFLGSEAGHLASTMDSFTFNKRIAERQLLYVEPLVVRPLIDRLQRYGILPALRQPDYTIAWRDLNTLSDKDKALVSLQRSQALMQYVTGGCEAVMPVREFLTLVLGLTAAEAQLCLDAVARNRVPLTDPLGDKAAKRDADLQVKTAKALPAPKPQGGGTRGNPPRRPVGRRPGNLPQN